MSESAKIDVQVTYAGGREGPWRAEYESSARLSTVRADAMNHFQLSDTTDPAGNQIVYKLMHGGDTINDLNRTVGEEAGGKPHLVLRLVRQVIAG